MKRQMERVLEHPLLNCSRFALIAHSSPQNLTILRVFRPFDEARLLEHTKSMIFSHLRTRLKLRIAELRKKMNRTRKEGVY
jgi:hypothetical protein